MRKRRRPRAPLRPLDDVRLASVRGGACQAEFNAMISLSRAVAPGSSDKLALAVKAYNDCNKRVFGK